MPLTSQSCSTGVYRTYVSTLRKLVDKFIGIALALDHLMNSRYEESENLFLPLLQLRSQAFAILSVTSCIMLPNDSSSSEQLLMSILQCLMDMVLTSLQSKSLQNSCVLRHVVSKYIPHAAQSLSNVSLKKSIRRFAKPKSQVRRETSTNPGSTHAFIVHNDSSTINRRP